MMRPGTKVNSPARTSAPAKVEIIMIRWRRTLCVRAATTARTSATGVRIDSRWMGLQGPSSLIWWIQKEEIATTVIRATQIQPTVRCGSVPFGAANCTMPSAKAAIAANAWSGIAGAASSNGARLMAGSRTISEGERGSIPGTREGNRDVNIINIGPGQSADGPGAGDILFAAFQLNGPDVTAFYKP